MKGIRRRVAAALSLVCSSRGLSTHRETLTEAVRKAKKEPLRMPHKLSPTAVTSWSECEQQFLFRSMWRLPEPESKILRRGNLVHSTLERMLDVDLEVSRDSLRQLFREIWLEQRSPELVDSLFPAGAGEEKEWGLQCFTYLDNYVNFENPDDVDVLETESWVKTSIGETSPPLNVVGRLDRLDRIDDDRVRVVDYKTSSKDYSNDEFFQLKCYALMLEAGDRKVDTLRIMYLGGNSARAVDFDLPTDPLERERLLESTKDRLVSVWNQIYQKVKKNDVNLFTHCERYWCVCHTVRPILSAIQDEGEAVEEVLAVGNQAAAVVSPSPAPAAAVVSPPSTVAAGKTTTTSSSAPLLKVKELRELCKKHNIDSVVKRGDGSARDILLQRLKDGSIL